MRAPRAQNDGATRNRALPPAAAAAKVRTPWGAGASVADIFISYKAERRPAVTYLARVLENHGYSVWFDHALLSGETFRPVIERELRDARAVLVLWCGLSINSMWVEGEAQKADAAGKLLPAMIEPVDIPIPYNTLDTIDLARWDGNPRTGEALDRLLDQIELRVGKPSRENREALRKQEAEWKLHRKSLAGSRSAPRTSPAPPGNAAV